MGHRANVIVVKGSATNVRHSQFGATSIPVDLLAGPDEFQAYAAEWDERAEPLDEAYCEGAVLLDHDRHEMSFFENTGNHYFHASPGLRRRYQPYLAERWVGWSVSWAAGGIRELGVRAGLPLQPRSARGATPQAADLAEVEQSLGVVTYIMGSPYGVAEYRAGVGEEAFFGNQPYQETLLSVRSRSGAVRDYTSCLPIEAWLGVGPSLLELLERKEGLPLPNELCVKEGAWLDPCSRELTIWWGWVPEPAHALEWLAQRWPGHEVRVQRDGFSAQVEASGRDAGSIRLPNENAARQVARMFSFAAEDARKTMENHIRQISAEGATNIIVPRTALEPGSVRMDRAAVGRAIMADMLVAHEPRR